MSYDKASAPGEREPSFYPVSQHEGSGSHKQATAAMAAERGWFFRSEWYKRMVPDTRRCWVHGEIMFDELPLTDVEKKSGYVLADAGMATGGLQPPVQSPDEVFLPDGQLPSETLLPEQP